MKIQVVRSFATTALVLLCASSLIGSPVGNIAGSIKDPTGALVPGVRLTLTNTATNAKVVATTNANGEFQFLQLAPSTYSLVAELSGFKRAMAPAIVVQVDQVTHLDL